MLITSSTPGIEIINSLLCVLLAILSWVIYKKEKLLILKAITFAYSIFVIPHILKIVSMIFGINLFIPILLSRATSYSMIIIALILNCCSGILKKKKKFLNWTYFIIFLTSIIILNIAIYFRHLIIDNFFTVYQKYPLRFLDLVNIIFCLIIIILALINNKKEKSNIYLFMSIAFFTPVFSYILDFFVLSKTFSMAYFLLRVIHYLALIYAVSCIKKIAFLEKLIKFSLNIKFQIFLILSTALMLLILFYFPNKRFNCTDPKPDIYPIVPKTTDEQIIEIKTGLYINDFPVFDITGNNFVADVTLWFEFDPHLISLDIIDKFYFLKSSVIKKQNPDSRIIKDKLRISYKMRIEFKADLNFDQFPIDDHSVALYLTNPLLNPNETVLTSQSTNFVINDKIFTGDWKLINKKTEYGYSKIILDERRPEISTPTSVLYFSMDFEKIGIKNSLIIFVPLFISFFLSLCSLIINIENKSVAVSLAVGSVSALIYDLFVIEKKDPNVSYFTLSDSVFTLLILSVFIIILFTIFIEKRNLNKDTLEKYILLRNTFFLFFIMFILLAIYYLLY